MERNHPILPRRTRIITRREVARTTLYDEPLDPIPAGSILRVVNDHGGYPRRLNVWFDDCLSDIVHLWPEDYDLETPAEKSDAPQKPTDSE